MCLIAIAHRAHADYPLVVAANRDEYHHRPTRASAFWDESPQLLAGRDLEAGGTWMGITRSLRFAAITNHRNPPGVPAQPRSRGLLTLDFLLGDSSPEAYLAAIAERGQEYAGFNLLIGTGDELWYYSNIQGLPERLDAGVYALSNANLTSAWPKQDLAANELEGALNQAFSHETLRTAVSSREAAEDTRLPDTGVGRDMESWLSAQFIVGDSYGTRSTTTMWLHREGKLDWEEHCFDASGALSTRQNWEFSSGGRE